MKLILASSSPRRRELLSQIKVDFEIINPSDDAENPLPRGFCSNPEDFAVSNATLKARSAAEKAPKDAIVLGADTIVVLDGIILGKPENNDDARRMLSMLSGKTHKVMTGLCVTDCSTGKLFSDIEVTSVVFKQLSESDIDSYIESGEPLGKAGAYAIQGLGSLFIPSISGCYFNVVGLPIFRTMQLINKILTPEN